MATVEERLGDVEEVLAGHGVSSLDALHPHNMLGRRAVKTTAPSNGDIWLWRDANGRWEPTSILAAVLLPQTPLSFDGGTAASAAPTTTSALVGLVRVHSPIVANRVTYFPIGSGSANAVMRLALYREDGGLKLFDVTNAVGDAASGEQTETFTAVFLPPGNYYIFACLASGTTSPAIIVFNTSTAFVAGASGEPDIQGDLTVTAGAAPATFDPTGLTTGEDKTIAFRLDGQ